MSRSAALLAARALAAAPVIRLDRHLADLGHDRPARAGRDLLGRLLDQGRLPVTHSQLLETQASRDVGQVAPSDDSRRLLTSR